MSNRFPLPIELRSPDKLPPNPTRRVADLGLGLANGKLRHLSRLIGDLGVDELRIMQRSTPIAYIRQSRPDRPVIELSEVPRYSIARIAELICDRGWPSAVLRATRFGSRMRWAIEIEPIRSIPIVQEVVVSQPRD